MTKEIANRADLISEAECIDNMEYMARFPDKFFDLAIVDPPYGIGEDWKKRRNTSTKYDITYNNKSIPGELYFNELKRVSRNYIIWGWNYYTEFLGPTNYLIVWDKVTSDATSFYSQVEIAATNIRIPARIFKYPWDGARKGTETGIDKIHPHQKPVALYRWLLQKYAQPGFKIIDTNYGSQSSRIAAHIEGFDIWGCDNDPEIFRAGCDRYNQFKQQLVLF